VKFAIVAACAVLSGCALQPRASEWTDQERIAFGASLAGHAVDLGSSLASDDRCVEKHIFLGEHPSNGALIGIKALAIAAEYLIYNSPGMGEHTHWFGYVSGAIHFGVGVSNLQNECY